MENKSNSPWYAPEHRVESPLKVWLEKYLHKKVQKPRTSNKLIVYFFMAVLLIAASGVLLGLAVFDNNNILLLVLGVLLSVVLCCSGFLFLLNVIGMGIQIILPKSSAESGITIGINFLQSRLETQEIRKSIPAPELALTQFVAQVRAYATESTYQRNRDLIAREPKVNAVDATDLLKRRWNEVLDSLNEFEIYLANSPKSIIEKLVAKSPMQLMDVSQIFRDVAESFDTTWRRKGINIEAAIVIPLKAHANEALLRRLLVGPWRSSAYFARRGSGVVFSAKAINGKVIAAWECNGLCIPDSFLAIAKDSNYSVNERIEKGMVALALDPSSSNTFHALVSFITWIDLANTCNADYAFKHTNDGFAIELRLH